MPELLLILLKINVVLLLFAVAYYLILRRLTFYVLNRVFLAFGILFSSAYPFIDLTDFFQRQNPQVIAFVPKINQKATELVPSTFITQYWPWISGFFYVGVVFMALRLLIQFVSLYRMHQKSTPGAVANYKVRILTEAVSPFSFWQTVYINPSLHKELELKTILAHENIHVKGWHSLDIILAELSVVFYWFNPGVWLMKKAVKENLEFITDEKILKKGIDRKAYQYSLLDVGSLTPSVAIVNNFNLSDLKKRIKMMNVKRSSHLTLSRYLLVLPVLLTTTLAFTVTKKDIQQNLKPLQQVLGIRKVHDSVPLVERKSPQTKVVDLKRDTAKTIKFLYNTIFISTKDTTIDGVTRELLAQMALQRVKNGDTAAKVVRFVHGMRLSEKQGELLDANTIELSRRFEGAPSGDVDLPKGRITLKVSGLKLRGDSIASQKTTFYLNGKQLPENDLSAINPDEIKSVTIQKPKDIREVIVIGKKKVQ
jgi:hypothetical protein